ncbi:MAG: DUF2975 domain-containing protein [Cytophagales bacterium]|nr:DUF2975 domain-containing protein [Cytophagales bacterium]
MKQNNSLLIAYRILQFFFGFCGLLFVVFTIVMIMGITDAAFAEQFNIPDAGQPGAGVSLNWCKADCNDSVNQLSVIPTATKWWILIRASIFFVLTLLIMRRAAILLKTVIDGKTFYRENIEAFSQMAKYGLLIAALSAFNFYYKGDVEEASLFSWSLDVPFVPLMFALGCKVLAEIFKQGQLLSEENQSFV